jgi:hypothetical protein
MTVSFCPYVPGPVLVKVNLRNGDGLQTLGYTTEGVQVEEISFTNKIHSDRYGGTAGPPIDTQYFGKAARIQLQMVEYDLSVLKEIRDLQDATGFTAHAAGEIVDIGTLMTCASRSWQIVLVGERDVAAVAADAGAIVMTTLNFPNTFVEGPLRYPLGAKNSVFDLDLMALPWTSSTAQTGDGLTRLYIEAATVINNLMTYDATP